MINKFEITESHLKLAKRMYVNWNAGEYGAPTIDCKRPYGNSYIPKDIASILGWKLDEDDELTEDQEEKAMGLHEEVKTALQICLIRGEFKTGTFIRVNKYDYRSWKKIV